MTLNIGTLAANVKNTLCIKDTKKRQEIFKDTSKSPEAIEEDAKVASNVISCVWDAIRHANQTKRKCQGLFGMYIELVAADGTTPDDRLFLNHLCPPIAPEESGQVNTSNQDNQDAIDMDDDNEQSSTQQSFIACFMQYLYSNNHLTNQGIGIIITKFITCLTALGLHTPVKEEDALYERAEFQPSVLVQSVTSQLVVEMKKIYHNGTMELLEQVSINTLIVS